MLAGILLITILWAQQNPTDHSDKPCVVTRVVTEGVYSDCHGWQPAKGEKFNMPAEVSKKLRVGDTYYFVWTGDYWLAQIKETVAVILSPDSLTEIILRSEAQAQFKQLCADGTNDLRLKALAVALNPMPDWPQLVMNKEPNVCNRAPKPIVPIPIEKQSGSAFR